MLQNRRPVRLRYLVVSCAALLIVWIQPSALTLEPSGIAFGQRRDSYGDERREMVRRFLEREGITDERVLDVMRTVPRHEFVPGRQRRRAYLDLPLAIGYRQTISPPFIVAYMTQSLEPEQDDKVLEIGTGSGYQAAVLAGLAKEVYTIEIVEPLGRNAARTLERLGYDNVHVKTGDGYLGWPEHAPFDKIIVTCSPEEVPSPLVEQLSEGGRMIIPLGERYQQVFYLFEKRDGKLVEQKLIPTLFVPMTGESEQQREVKPDPLNPQVVNGDFEIDDNDDGLPDNWHYQRQTGFGEAAAAIGERYLEITNQEPGRLAQALQGMAVDGRQIAAVRISLFVQTKDVRPGPEPHEQPSLVVLFYDSVRRRIGEVVIGPWLGSRDWRAATSDIEIPRNTREIVLSVGLHGATGTLGIDGITLKKKLR